jgi:hypothetical protein
MRVTVLTPRSPFAVVHHVRRGYTTDAPVSRRAHLRACTRSFSIEDHPCLPQVKENPLSSFDTAHDTHSSTGNHAANGNRAHTSSRRLSTETKASFKTTELIAYVVAVLAVLIASAMVDASDFGAQEAWRYVTFLTIGYMVSRGLAKSGSRDFFDTDDTNGR